MKLVRTRQNTLMWIVDVLPHEIAMDNDIVLLNLGDNYGFHAGIASIIDQTPCLGIFHDFFLYSFFRDWALERQFTPAMPAERRDSRYRAWKSAVEATMHAAGR